MKRSNLNKISLAALLIGLGTWSAGSSTLALAESTYQPWSGASQTQASQQTPAQQLQKLVADLKTVTKKAETSNAADPNFLADLNKLVAQYDQMAALSTAGTVFLWDKFSDGNYTANPTWKVSAGTWRVDTKGTTTGLTSSTGQATSNKITGNDVMKAILGVQEQQAPKSTYASIYAPAQIGNSFKMTTSFTSSSANGPLNIGPYQGANATSGYRLVYQPGNETGLLLQRIVGNKVTQLGAYNDPIKLEDGKVHQLVWSREANGKMRVYVDGQQMIIVTDTQITGNLDGWLNVNQGGTYWIREIKVEGI
jgi:hypothetical protein